MIMGDNSFPGKLIRLVRDTINGVQNCVKISLSVWNPFYKAMLSALEGAMMREGFNMSGTMFNKPIKFICFADDVAIIIIVILTSVLFSDLCIRFWRGREK